MSLQGTSSLVLLILASSVLCEVFHLETAVGTFNSTVYESTMYDTYVIHPARLLTVDLACTGYLEDTYDYLRLYRDKCSEGLPSDSGDEEYIGRYTGTLSLSEAMEFSEGGYNCAYIIFDTDRDGNDYEGFRCAYSSTSYPEEESIVLVVCIGCGVLVLAGVLGVVLTKCKGRKTKTSIEIAATPGNTDVGEGVSVVGDVSEGGVGGNAVVGGEAHGHINSDHYPVSTSHVIVGGAPQSRPASADPYLVEAYLDLPSHSPPPMSPMPGGVGC
ncbi:hypothetical protein KIPB_001726 [Kipferlia bialata]|uniref:CUB domain-containing protein n=1 Tax=Kipferlia bialata TaxID=797122 RepID=A0A9K3CPD3_9EUKA|nr:hypothetical protein KIPB_001726 [Kipferlia bialata]|eukprot:g1726.t1